MMDLNVHKSVINNNEKYTGATLHIVTAKVDEGPILSYNSPRNVFHGESTISCQLHDMATELWLDTLNHNHDNN